MLEFCAKKNKRKIQNSSKKGGTRATGFLDLNESFFEIFQKVMRILLVVALLCVMVMTVESRISKGLKGKVSV